MRSTGRRTDAVMSARASFETMVKLLAEVGRNVACCFLFLLVFVGLRFCCCVNHDCRARSLRAGWENLDSVAQRG